jgi:hypothetical protein
MSSSFNQGGADPANGGYWFETSINVNDQKHNSHKLIIDEEPNNVHNGYFRKAAYLIPSWIRHLLKLHSGQRIKHEKVS